MIRLWPISLVLILFGLWLGAAAVYAQLGATQTASGVISANPSPFPTATPTPPPPMIFVGDIAVVEAGVCGGGTITLTLTPGDGIAAVAVTGFFVFSTEANLVFEFDPPIAIAGDGSFSNSEPLPPPLDAINVSISGTFDFTSDPATVTGTFTIGLVADPTAPPLCEADFTAEALAAAPTPTPPPTVPPTPTPTPCPTGKVPADSGCGTPTSTPTITPTRTPTSTPTRTPTPTRTATPTITPTPTPTATTTPTPTPTPPPDEEINIHVNNLGSGHKQEGTCWRVSYSPAKVVHDVVGDDTAGVKPDCGEPSNLKLSDGDPAPGVLRITITSDQRVQFGDIWHVQNSFSPIGKPDPNNYECDLSQGKCGVPKVAVGGLAVDLDGGEAGLALEAGGAAGRNVAVVAAIAAAVAAGAIALGGAAWWARRRWGSARC